MRSGPPWSLRLAMLMQFAAGGAVIPFVSILMRDRGLTYSQISLILMCSSVVSLFCPFFWGMLADRFVPLNRLFILINMMICLTLALMSGSLEFGGLLLAFVAYTAAMNPTFNLINALSFHHLPNPKLQFSTLRAWGSLGWILPFLPISLWTAWQPGAGLDFTLFFGMAIAFGMLLLCFWLPHTPPGAWRPGASATPPRAYLPAVRQLLRNSNYLVVLASMFLISGSFSLVMFYSPPFLEELGVARPWIGPVQAIGVVFEIALFQWQPWLIRRWNYTGTILVGCFALVARNLMFAFLDNLWLLSASYLLAGMVIVFFHMGVSMLVNSMATLEVRATAQTLLAICSQGLGPMFANGVAGPLTDAYQDSLRPVFLFASFLALLAACLIVARRRQLNRAGHSETVPLEGAMEDKRPS